MGLLRVVLKVLLKEERVGVQILAYEEIQIRKGISATTLRLEAILRLSDARRLLGFTKKKSDIRVLKGCRAQATRLRAEGPLHALASFSRLFAKGSSHFRVFIFGSCRSTMARTYSKQGPQ